MIAGRHSNRAGAVALPLAAGNIVDALRDDHAQLGKLFDRFVAAAQSENLPAVRERLAGRICEALSSQHLAQEEVLYPEIRKENDKLVFALLLADEGIARRIAEVRDAALPALERDLAMLRLIALVRGYMAEREQALFPFLRARLSDARMVWLGADYAQRKLLHAVPDVGDTAQAVGHDGTAPEDAAISLLVLRMRAAGEAAAARR